MSVRKRVSVNNEQNRNVHVPPHDEQAERSVLGALLLDKDAIVKVVEFLRPHHFYREPHQNIYSAVLSLFEKREPTDLITVPNELKKKGLLASVGGVAYLTELVNSVPTAANIEAYAKLIKNDYIKKSSYICISRDR
ncbi:MAG: hypothetical protein KatS3mg101_0469 [Patescibacteria group bacterium]|nr:MAG: hypothetical protein KatS3mg101_0469 [Patescibacteria group bacterium]